MEFSEKSEFISMLNREDKGSFLYTDTCTYHVFQKFANIFNINRLNKQCDIQNFTTNNQADYSICNNILSWLYKSILPRPSDLLFIECLVKSMGFTS